MLSYFERPKRITRHIQYNPLGFRQVFARTDYYRCSLYPMTIVLWNRLPSEIVLLPDLDSFKREVSNLDQLFNAIEKYCFQPAFNLSSLLTNLTISSFFHSSLSFF